MKTGLFFGSFNPVHIGHMALANYFVEYTDIELLWFVISPHNPLKKKESLINGQIRMDMVELAINGDNRFQCCDVEFHMPKPSYTIDSLTYLTEKYPRYKFILLMGSDGLRTFHKWKNSDQIIRHFPRYVYPRKNEASMDYSQHQNIVLIEDAPQIEISSSFIRKSIADKKDIRYFLPEKVSGYIDKYGLYK